MNQYIVCYYKSEKQKGSNLRTYGTKLASASTTVKGKTIADAITKAAKKVPLDDIISVSEIMSIKNRA